MSAVTLQCVLTSYERILIKFSVAVERDPKTRCLDFDGSMIQDPDTGSKSRSRNFLMKFFGGVGPGSKIKL